MYLSIFCSSVAVCMFATLFSALLPLDQLQKMLPILSHTIASHQIQFRENLLSEVAANPSHWILWIFLRYAARVFVYCGKEIISLVTVFHFVPTITNLLMGLMPIWILDVSNSVVQSLSSDDSDVPGLEMDPGAASLFKTKNTENTEDLADQDIYTESKTESRTESATESRTESRRVSVNSTEVSNLGEGSFTDTNGNGTKGSNDRNDHINKRVSIISSLGQSCHVFDPVLGVIPRETRDLWMKSKNRSDSKDYGQNHNRENSSKIENSNSGIEDRGDTTLLYDTVIVEKHADFSEVRHDVGVSNGNNGVAFSRVRKPLPPVRFS